MKQKIMQTAMIACFMAVSSVSGYDWLNTHWNSRTTIGATAERRINDGAGQSVINLTIPPFSLSGEWNLWISPFYKVDAPFQLWAGAGVYDFAFATMETSSQFKENLTYSQWNLAAIGGIGFPISQNLDLNLGGGLAHSNARFTHTMALSKKLFHYSFRQTWAEASVDYIAATFKNKTYMKIGGFYRYYFSNAPAIAIDLKDTSVTAVPSQIQSRNYSFLQFRGWQLGVNFTYGFGRETPKERRIRQALKNQQRMFRNQYVPEKPLDSWACQEISSEYGYYLTNLNDPEEIAMRTARSDYMETLERFIYYCIEDHSHRAWQLYRAIDSTKRSEEQLKTSNEQRRFYMVLNSRSTALHRRFMEYYPNSEYIPQVQANLAVLEEEIFFYDALKTNSIRSLVSYIDAYPTGKFYEDAETEIFKILRASNKIQGYQRYLERFPEGRYRQDAIELIEDLRKAYSSPLIRP